MVSKSGLKITDSQVGKFKNKNNYIGLQVNYTKVTVKATILDKFRQQLQHYACNKQQKYVLNLYSIQKEI